MGLCRANTAVPLLSINPVWPGEKRLARTPGQRSSEMPTQIPFGEIARNYFQIYSSIWLMPKSKSELMLTIDVFGFV
jgi:hypothetical protein